MLRLPAAVLSLEQGLMILLCDITGWLQASVRYVLRVKLDSTSAAVRQMCRDCGFVVCRPLDLNQVDCVSSPRHWTLRHQALDTASALPDTGHCITRHWTLRQHSQTLDTGHCVSSPRHWMSAAAAFVDQQLPPVDVSSTWWSTAEPPIWWSGG